MSAVAEAVAAAKRDGVWDGPIIDCDVHAQFAGGLKAFWGHLDHSWQEFITERGYRGPPSLNTVYPIAAPSSARSEWRPDDETMPASSVRLLQGQALDAWQVERAIVNCYAGLDSCRHPDLAAALARAINDWLVEDWLEKDDRLRASMVIPIHTIADAVREIERVGNHPGFVQVLMPVRAPALYGKRNWYPLFEAVTAHDLVFGMHFGGTSDGAPTPCGWPSWYIEEYVGEQQVYMSQLTSMVAEGLFQSFPTLRIAVLEIGFAWVPSVMWRLDKEWKGLRRSVPWMNTAPSELIRRHLKFSTAPLNAGPPEHMAQLVEWLGEDMVMFASDYPHQHAADIDTLLRVIPQSARAKIMHGNARDFYRFA
jgi:uncharacterized protein